MQRRHNANACIPSEFLTRCVSLLRTCAGKMNGCKCQVRLAGGFRLGSSEVPVETAKKHYINGWDHGP
jgi:hypothetical protein